MDEADPTRPDIGPGLAKTRSGAMSAPVEVGNGYGKDGDVFSHKKWEKNAK